MKKIILLICLALTACTPSASEKRMPVMPKGLEDCSVYTINDGELGVYTVFRCPDSTTTTSYKEGKTTKTVVVIDGKEYQEVTK
jgi:hypothetical protein